MGYSRRHRFADGRSGLPRLEFARPFAVVLRPHPDAGRERAPAPPQEHEVPVRPRPGL